VSGKSGFAIGIGVVDEASAKLDALNKRIQALNAPSERFNKSMTKFGEVTGITRVAEGVKGLGDNALESARALERMVSPLGLLTSAASIAGIAELTRRWADAGNTIGKVSYQLNTPVEKISALRLAAKMAGASAEGMDSALGSLNDHLHAVAFHMEKSTLLDQLGIKAGTQDNVTSVATALGQLADHIQMIKDPHTQQRALDLLGMGDLLPLLKNGKAGLDEFIAKAQKTGGVMTGSMAEDAKQLHTAWERLGGDIDGVVNRLTDKYEPKIKGLLSTTSDWIEKNKQTADSITEIGTAILGLVALKPAAWILRLLGLGAVSTVGGAVAGAVAGEEMLYYGTRIGDAGPSQSEEDALSNFKGRNEGRNRTLAGPRANSGNALDTGTVSRATQLHDKLMKAGIPGMTDARAWGFAGNAVQESRADPNSQPGDMGAAHGLMMWRDSADGGHRYTDYRNKYGHAPEQGNMDEAVDFIKTELTGSEAAAWRKIQQTGNTPGEAGAAVSTFYERPKDTAAEEERRWGLSQRLAGGVHVTVDVKHNGTSAASTSTASGAATTAPPRIETSMPMGL